MTEENVGIDKLSAALSKAQGMIEGAKADAENPHFKSKYADLASVWDAVREALAANELAVVQVPRAVGNVVEVETILTHSSGQSISGKLAMTAQKNTPQGIGSCITYARRYALMGFLGVAPEDDDGNDASTGTATKAHLTNDQLKRLYALQSQSKWSVQELKGILKVKYQIESSRELSLEQYKEVCNALAANPKPQEEPEEPKTVEEMKEDGDVMPASELEE